MYRICFSPKPKVGFTSISSRSHARVQYNGDDEKKVDTESNDKIQHLVVDQSRIWTRKKLKVFFYRPEKEEMEKEEMTFEDYCYNVRKVLHIASEWSPHTGIKFEETLKKAESDVRVAFGHASEWSMANYVKEASKASAAIPICAAAGTFIGGPVGYFVGLAVGSGVSYLVANEHVKDHRFSQYDKKDLPKKQVAWAILGQPPADEKYMDITVRLAFPCFHKRYTKLTVQHKREFWGTVLHEFGHVLGFRHENMGEIPYDKEAVKKYYREVHKWDDKKIEQNVLSEIDAASTVQRYGEYDPKSIMSYAVDERMLDKKVKNYRKYIHGFNFTLSANDKKMARQIYGIK